MMTNERGGDLISGIAADALGEEVFPMRRIDRTEIAGAWREAPGRESSR